jgi:hypothetical protein
MIKKKIKFSQENLTAKGVTWNEEMVFFQVRIIIEEMSLNALDVLFNIVKFPLSFFQTL